MWEHLAREVEGQHWKAEVSTSLHGEKLLDASSTVANVAVLVDLGWRKLEERRVESKVL